MFAIHKPSAEPRCGGNQRRIGREKRGSVAELTAPGAMTSSSSRPARLATLLMHAMIHRLAGCGGMMHGISVLHATMAVGSWAAAGYG